MNIRNEHVEKYLIIFFDNRLCSKLFMVSEVKNGAKKQNLLLFPFKHWALWPVSVHCQTDQIFDYHRKEKLKDMDEETKFKYVSMTKNAYR